SCARCQRIGGRVPAETGRMGALACTRRVHGCCRRRAAAPGRHLAAPACAGRVRDGGAALVASHDVARTRSPVRAGAAFDVFVVVRPFAQFQRSDACGAARMAPPRERLPVRARRAAGLGAHHVAASCVPRNRCATSPEGRARHENCPPAFGRPRGGLGGPAVLGFSIVARMMPPAVDDAIDLSRVRRALVIKLRHHGDVLMASPVFTVLKRAAPHAEVDALVYQETAPMLERHPAISILHTIDRSIKDRGPAAQLIGDGRLWGALRARHYDLVVHLTEHPRGAWLTRIAGARWGVAPERARSGWFWRRCFTHRYLLPRSTPRHAVEADLDALRRIGIWPEESEKKLVHVPGPDAEKRVAALLATHRLARGRFVLIHPGPRWVVTCGAGRPAAAPLDRT